MAFEFLRSGMTDAFSVPDLCSTDWLVNAENCDSYPSMGFLEVINDGHAEVK